MKYNKEILNRFLNDKVAIAVRTSKEWDKFMQLLEEEEADVKWPWTLANPTELNYWREYRDNSIIFCDDAQRNELEYADVTYQKDMGYEIIEFKELIEVANVL